MWPLSWFTVRYGCSVLGSVSHTRHFAWRLKFNLIWPERLFTVFPTWLEENYNLDFVWRCFNNCFLLTNIPKWSDLVSEPTAVQSAGSPIWASSFCVTMALSPPSLINVLLVSNTSLQGPVSYNFQKCSLSYTSGLNGEAASLAQSSSTELCRWAKFVIQSDEAERHLKVAGYWPLRTGVWDHWCTENLPSHCKQKNQTFTIYFCLLCCHFISDCKDCLTCLCVLSDRLHVFLGLRFWSMSIQIYSWMDTLVAQHPNLVTKLEIGKSYEKRPMYVLKVGTQLACANTLYHNFLQINVFANFVFSSALEAPIALLSGWTWAFTPGSGCLRPLECGQPTR